MHSPRHLTLSTNQPPRLQLPFKKASALQAAGLPPPAPFNCAGHGVMGASDVPKLKPKETNVPRDDDGREAVRGRTCAHQSDKTPTRDRFAPFCCLYSHPLSLARALFSASLSSVVQARAPPSTSTSCRTAVHSWRSLTSGPTSVFFPLIMRSENEKMPTRLLSCRVN